MMHVLILFWIMTMSGFVWSNGEVVQWPTCSETTTTRNIFNMKSENGNLLFDSPLCLPYTTFCSLACCRAQANNKVLRGVLASSFEALRYYVNGLGTPSGTYPVPFFYFHKNSRSFRLAAWNSQNHDMFKFRVVYLNNQVFLEYIGNVPEGARRLLAPYVSPSSTLSKTSPDNVMTIVRLESIFRINHAMASACSCGYYDAIHIQPNSNCNSKDPSRCYKNFKGTLKCLDIDECEAGTDNCHLIPNSHCVNTRGGFECHCNSEYLKLDSQCRYVGAMISTETLLTSTTARVYVTSEDLPIPSWSYSYNVTDISNPTNPMPVYNAMQIKVSQQIAKTGVLIQDLIPGTNYSMKFDILDANGTVITDKYAYTSDTRFKTHCTCGLESDAPVLLGNETVTQEYGHIYFKFLGNSMCGNAYTFARQSFEDDGNLSTIAVFTPNYYFTGGQCSPIPYEPGKSASDVLANSKLIVGEKYRYSIRAVGEKYLGDVSSVDFDIHWESSISGYVGLKPSHGDLPVDGVLVQWKLKDDNGTTVLDGSTTTSKSGRFTIHLNALLSFLNDHDYPIHLSISKVTQIDETHQIQHQFLCNGGRVNCTNTDLIVHLKHLDFNVPVNIYDATSVPISGKVYVAETSVDSDGARWGGDGCPIEKARVCLVDRSPSSFQNELICTETSGDGTYTLPGVIGSRVSIKVTYHNHSFEYVPDPAYSDFSLGIEIQANMIYERNNFMDITTVPLQLTIAGGVCDLPLGAAVVSYSINGCLWGGRTLHQPSWRDIHNSIPAMNMRFSVDTIQSRPDINMPPQNLDLTKALLRENSQQSFDQEPRNASDPPELRFQYNGTSKIRVVFQRDMNSDCITMTPDIASLEANSIHVLPFQQLSHATIFIERDLGAGNICDVVDPSTQIIIQNNLGLKVDSTYDDAYALSMAKYPEKLELLYHCSRGCLANVTHDYDPLLKRYKRARVEFQFMTGPPNHVAPFTKQLILQTSEPNSVSYTAAVVVTGQYKKGDLYSVGLPTHNPVLIIRDPPGGSSYSFYEKVRTTLRIQSFKHTEYTGPDIDFKLLAGINYDIGQCLGFGVYLCQKVAKLKNVVGFHHKSSSLLLRDFNHTVKSGGLSTTWSYKTPSSNPLFAGNVSDTYVVPNLNMKFSVIDTVSWNQSTCTASSIEETAYNLKSPENVPALAFVTGFEIIHTEIPSLELNIESTEKKLDETTNTAERKRLQNDLTALRDALNGWRDALKLNEDLKRNAIETGNAQQVKPHEWFDKIAVKEYSNDTHAIETTGMAHYSGLLPDDLVSRSSLRPLYRKPQSVKFDLESTNTIKFSGGGNELTFRISQSKMQQHISDLGGNKKDTSISGVDIETDNTFTLVNLIVNLEMADHDEISDENLQTDETSLSTNIGFSLSDPDAGDLFDVDVFIDPVFGTFIFHTRSGKSVCKHEAGTENRQLVQMELISIPPIVVLENEPMVFHFRITKMGIGSLGYMLSHDLREDSDGLAHYPFLPREYLVLEAGQSFIATIKLTRGPEKYEYPPFVLVLQPSCEFKSVPLLGDEATMTKVELYNYIDPSDQSKKLVFARPCSPLILRGDISKDQTFAVMSNNPDATVKVVVQNPMSSVMKWANATKDASTRLKRVQLYYRPVGSVSWFIGQHVVDDSMVDIDFAAAGLEDAYGFVTVAWQVSHLADGNYEMQVRTMCDDMSDAPAIFNGQETEVIQGVFDRKPPKLYGLPQPQKQLPIGKPITLTFDEPLDCDLPLKFVVELEVQGNGTNLGTHFGNDNLLLICEDRTISIQFDAAHVDLHSLIGQRMSMNITYIVDANKNLMVSPVSYSADIVEAHDDRSTCQNQLDELRKEIFDEIERSRQVTLENIANLTTNIIDSIRSVQVP